MASLPANKSQKRIAPSRSYRFDARLNENQKLLIQKAADLEGRSLTDFVLNSAESAATRTIQERTMTVLNARDSEAFVQLLLNSPAPGHVLRKAVKRYKKLLGV